MSKINMNKKLFRAKHIDVNPIEELYDPDSSNNQNSISIISESIDPKKSKKKSKLSRIKENIVNLVLESTAHGLPSVFKEKRIFFKLMWLCFFFMSTTAGIYFIASAVVDYLKFEVISHHEIVYDQPALFPTITFPFLWSWNSNFDLDDYTLWCTWNEKKCTISTDFETLYDPQQSLKYYKFNSGKNGSSSIPMKYQTRLIYYGLYLELFNWLPQSLNDSIKSDQYNFIYIHNNSKNPVIIGNQYKIQLRPNCEYDIVVKRTFIIKEEKPYNNCFKNLTQPDAFDSDLYRFMIENVSSAYSQADCFDLCQAKHLISICNSSTPLAATSQIWSNETSDDEEICFSEHWNDLSDNIHEYCSPSCPLECDSVKYDIEYSCKNEILTSIEEASSLFENRPITTKFPTDYNITYDLLKRTITAVNIFYEDFYYTTIYETPKIKLLDLVSSFGGLLGLFIGISFLSFGEVVELVFEVVFIIFERNS